MSETHEFSENEVVVDGSETPSLTKTTRAKKLVKNLVKFPGKVTITVEGGSCGEMTFDPGELPEVIQGNLVPFGLGHKLGDSAAGRAGTDAEESIKKVWEGLVKGEWLVRTPASPKVSISDIRSTLDKLSPEDRAAAEEAMKMLGITL